MRKWIAVSLVTLLLVFCAAPRSNAQDQVWTGRDAHLSKTIAIGDTLDNRAGTKLNTSVIRTHLESNAHVFGIAAIPAGETHIADHETMTPFQSDAGNDQFGSWVQVLGSEDTPHISGRTFYCFDAIMISDVEAQTDKDVHLIQFAFGTSGAAAYSAEDVAELITSPEKGGKESILHFNADRHPVGTKGWVRHWVDGENTGTMDFFIVVHEFDE